MIANLKRGSYFISLPQFLYDILKESCKGNENISFDLAAYLLFLIRSKSYADKEIEKKSGVALNSELLRKLYDTTKNKIKYKCSEHLEFLKQIKLIDIEPYIHRKSGKNNSSRKYKILDYDKQNSAESSQSFGSGYHTVEIKEKGLKRKLIKNSESRKVSANRTIPFLTKWLSNDYFKLDKQAALKYVNDTYSDGDDKKDKRVHLIENYEMMKNDYSREGKDDRLHHYFVSIPSDIRSFITYDESRLIELDIKNSQPLFLTKLFKLIIDTYYLKQQGNIDYEKYLNNNIIKSINNDIVLDIDNIVYNITTILLNSINDSDCQSINEFCNLVQSGQIYEEAGEKLLELGLIWKEDELFYAELYDKKSKKLKACDFTNLRKCAKKITINALYCNPRKHNQAVKAFREMFPVVTNVLDILKKTSHKDLPILLQRMESKFILDTCCKKITKKYPNMLLISRHDSLSTTEDNVSSLKDEFQTLLNGYFNFEVKLGQEYW